jgi:hypothetical protein
MKLLARSRSRAILALISVLALFGSAATGTDDDDLSCASEDVCSQLGCQPGVEEVVGATNIVEIVTTGPVSTRLLGLAWLFLYLKNVLMSEVMLLAFSICYVARALLSCRALQLP